MKKINIELTSKELKMIIAALECRGIQLDSVFIDATDCWGFSERQYSELKNKLQEMKK